MTVGVKMAERVRFELTCRNYPTIRFRVGAVMTASVPLRAGTHSNLGRPTRGAYSSRTMTESQGAENSDRPAGLRSPGPRRSGRLPLPCAAGDGKSAGQNPPPSRPRNAPACHGASRPISTATSRLACRTCARRSRPRRATPGIELAGAGGAGLPGVALATRGRITARRPGRDDADAASRRRKWASATCFPPTRTSSAARATWRT